MKSINFEFLRSARPELADLGGFAEQYQSPDPSSCLVKLRDFGEQVVSGIYSELALPLPIERTQYNLLTETSFEQAVPEVVRAKLHGMRIEGNKAAHGQDVAEPIAARILEDAFQVGCWLHLSYLGGAQADLPAFQAPPTGGAAGETKAKLKREKRAVLEQLARQEARMAQLLADLEAARKEAAAARKEAESEAERAKRIQEAVAKSQRAVSTLAFDEEATRRRLIDTQLVAAGWNVGTNGANTDEVKQERPVSHQPTDTGEGAIDYLLVDKHSGDPLAVIEAKKTSRSAKEGRTQAKLYADGIEKETGKRPVIFYTNGYEIFIWNDRARGKRHETPRQIHGFYSPDSLQYLLFTRENRRPLLEVPIDQEIAGRDYQMEAIKTILGEFDEQKSRKGLLVMATGTGKTRVAVALSKVMLEAKAAKRILFLCDRRELRKQAGNAFKEHLPGAPRANVTAKTYKERHHQIYLATYPAMMKCHETFDVGFFDVVIADESHRSIYNRYKPLFDYFDAYQIGLTATPVESIARSTFKMFGCEEHEPTFSFGFREAIESDPPYLVPFRVVEFQTKFQRDGLKFKELTPAQKLQAIEQEETAENWDYEGKDLDRVILNKDTNRHVLQNLMEAGIRDYSGQEIGKTIIFARNHKHAELLEDLFNEMYPQYGGEFCEVIDNYNPRAEQLIDDFKDPLSSLTVAISVDMLDTGVDIPEVVNLVFAKPVKSYVKFWQMIGRGTRLCESLFGDGDDKTHFLVFDHFKNFDYFENDYPGEPTDSRQKSLLEKLFESRIALADAALDAADTKALDIATSLIGEDLNALPMKSVEVKKHWRTIEELRAPDTLKQFSPATRAVLLGEVAPLNKWRSIRKSGHESAYQFDLLMARLEAELLAGSSAYQDFKDRFDVLVAALLPSLGLNQVREKEETIKRVRSIDFWDGVTVEDLEQVRRELRDIMRFRRVDPRPRTDPKVVDVTEDLAGVRISTRQTKLEGLDLVQYRKQWKETLGSLIDKSPALRKVRLGQAVDSGEIEDLAAQVHSQDEHLSLEDLSAYDPELPREIDRALRRIVGLDAEAVDAHFREFHARNPSLTAPQTHFLRMIKNHIGRYGALEIEKLYEQPFTTLHAEGLEGVFPDERQVEALVGAIQAINALSTGNDQEEEKENLNDDR